MAMAYPKNLWKDSLHCHPSYFYLPALCTRQWDSSRQHQGPWGHPVCRSVPVHRWIPKPEKLKRISSFQKTLAFFRIVSFSWFDQRNVISNTQMKSMIRKCIDNYLYVYSLRSTNYYFKYDSAIIVRNITHQSRNTHSRMYLSRRR